MVNEIIHERILRRLKTSIKEIWGDGENGEEILRDIYLTNTHGCAFNDKYVGSEILDDINGKFDYYLNAIIQEFDEYNIELVIVPLYDEPTKCLLIYQDKVIFRFVKKAWHFWYINEADMCDEIEYIYQSIVNELNWIRIDKRYK